MTLTLISNNEGGRRLEALAHLNSTVVIFLGASFLILWLIFAFFFVMSIRGAIACWTRCITQHRSRSRHQQSPGTCRCSRTCSSTDRWSTAFRRLLLLSWHPRRALLMSSSLVCRRSSKILCCLANFTINFFLSAISCLISWKISSFRSVTPHCLAWSMVVSICVWIWRIAVENELSRLLRSSSNERAATSFAIHQDGKVTLVKHHHCWFAA